MANTDPPNDSAAITAFILERAAQANKARVYPIGCITKGMRGEEIPHVYAGFSGLMGDRIYGVVAADGDPAFPWHTGRDQEEFVLYNAKFKSGEDLLLPENLDAFEGLAPGIYPLYPDADAFKVEVETPEGKTFDIDSKEFLEDLEKTTERSLRLQLKLLA